MKKMRGFLSVIIAVLIMFPFAIVNAEDAAATAEYTVKFDIINGINEDGDFDDQVANEANGFKVTNPGKPYTQKAFFIGWYSDKAYSTKFDFTKEINANTTVYAKYLLVSEVENKIKNKIASSNLSVTSTLTEKEALEYQKSGDQDLIDASLTKNFNNIPIDIESNIKLLPHDPYYDISDENKVRVYIEYNVYDDYGNTSYGWFEIDLDIKFANTDNEDATLKEKANNIVGNLEDELFFEDYTEMTDQQLHSEHDSFKHVSDKIKEMDTDNNFNIVKISEGIYGDERGQGYGYSLALTNGDFVYDYASKTILYAYKIPVDQSVENTHAAYLASIKEKLMDFLVNEKGFDKDDIEIDPDDMYSIYSASRMIVRIGGVQGDVYSFYMLKDDDSILLTKNLMINRHDYINNYVYALSYSENKDVFEDEYYENQAKGIEEMKSSLESEGYDFFDGYYVFATTNDYLYYYDYIPLKQPIKLTFTVGTENNNRRIKVLHRLDNGAVEKFEGIVKDGRFTIEITQGSPFAVGLGEVVKALKNNPQTFDPIVLTIMLLVVSALGACVSIKLLKD